MCVQFIGNLNIEKLGIYINKVITSNVNTIILLKKIMGAGKNARVVIKIAVAEDEKHPKNSIITLMKLNESTWKQTVKNRGDIIFQKN